MTLRSTTAPLARARAQAMRAADPNIKIGAVGGENFGKYVTMHYPEWDRIVLQKAGSQMDFLEIHNAYAPALVYGDQGDLPAVYQSMLAAPHMAQPFAPPAPRPLPLPEGIFVTGFRLEP